MSSTILFFCNFCYDVSLADKDEDKMCHSCKKGVFRRAT